MDPKNSQKEGGFTRRSILVVICLVALPILTYAAAPEWWLQYGISTTQSLSTSKATDYSAINQGQLKNLANGAASAMDSYFPEGAGSDIHALVGSWSISNSYTSDYSAVNLGQLKSVAKPFYDKLIQKGYAQQYPWLSNTVSIPSDYSLANIGQAKNLFSFDPAQLAGYSTGYYTNASGSWYYGTFKNYYYSFTPSSQSTSMVTRHGWNSAQATNYYNFLSSNPTLMATGLTAWFRSDKGVIRSSNNKISKWVDQVTGNFSVLQNSNNSQPTIQTNVINGCPAINFNGFQTLTNTYLPSDPALNSDITLIAVCNTTNNSALQYSVAMGTWGNPYTCRSLGYNRGSQFMDSYGISPSGAPASSNGTYSVEACSVGPGLTNTIFYRNGTIMQTNTIGQLNGLTAGFNIGVARPGGVGWQGNIAELLVYDHQLTASEFSQVSTYLGSRYNTYAPGVPWLTNFTPAVQAVIASKQFNKDQADSYKLYLSTLNSSQTSIVLKHQWTITQAQNYFAMQSNNPGMLTSGLTAWFSSGNGVLTDSNGYVTTWIDQSTGAYTVSQTNQGQQPVYLTNTTNGYPLISFSGSNSLINPAAYADAGLNSDMTVIVVGDSTNNTLQQYAVTLGTWGTMTRCRALGYFRTAQVMDAYGISPNGAPAAANNTFTTEAWSLSPGLGSVSFYRNGNLTSSKSISGMGTLSPGIAVGASRAATETWQGSIAEILVYDHQLSASEWTNVNSYLNYKYYRGWVSDYSPSIQQVIQKHQWSHQQAAAYAKMVSNNPSMLTTGLTAWLRADGGVSVDTNGNVSSLTDQVTGNFSVGATSQSSGPTLITNALGGKSVLRFYGNQGLANDGALADPGLNSDMTMIVVGSTSSNYQQQYAVSIGAFWQWGARRALGYCNGLQQMDAYGIYAFGTNSPGNQSYTMEAWSLAGDMNTVSFYRNGNLTATNSLNGTLGNLNNGIYLGESYDGLGYNWSGDIAEILVYDHQLSPQEMLQVSSYVSGKYGLYSSNAPWLQGYTTDQQAEINKHQWSQSQAVNYAALQSNNPTILTTGLSAWFKADSGVSVDSSNNVTSWGDQTGNYNVNQSDVTDGYAPTYVTNDLNRLPALRFNGGQFLASTAQVDNGWNSDITIITVGATTNPSTGSQQYSCYVGGGGNAGDSRGMGYNDSWSVINGYWQLLNTQYADYDGIGLNGINPIAFGAFALEATTLASDLQTVGFYRNGTPTAGGSVTGITNISGGITLGARSGGIYGWQGDIAEVLVYDHQLSPQEMAQVSAYISGKYGLYSSNAPWLQNYSLDQQAAISRHQWNQTQAANYVALQSNNPIMLTAGLSAWFKADTGVTTNSDGAVLSWIDQLGNITVTQSNVVQQPSYVSNAQNGLPAVRFNGFQGLANASSVPDLGLTNDLTVIAVGNTTNNTAQQYAVAMGTWGNWGQMRSLGYLSSLQLMDTYGSQGQQYVLGTNAPNNGVYVSEGWSLSPGATNVTFSRNGSITGIVPIGGVSAISTGFYIGESSDQVCGWQGDVAEVLVYDHQLSQQEMAQVSAYISGKYGLYSSNAPWLQNYSVDQQAEINKHQWNATQASKYAAMQAANANLPTTGLSVWFNAASGVSTSGSNVIGWTDLVTGNFSVTQSNAAQQPSYVSNTLNGLPSVRFNGAQGLSNLTVPTDPGLTNDLTVIAVANTTNNVAQQYSVSMGTWGSWGQMRLLGYASSQEILNTYGNYRSQYVFGTNVANNSSYTMEGWSLSPGKTNAIFYRNGSVNANQPINGVSTISSGFNLGQAYNGVYGWQGDITEILVYDHQLSPQEMAQVSAYISGKYGLYSSNAPWLQNYSVDQQAEINKHQWNQSQAYSYALMQSNNTNVMTSGLTAWFRGDNGVITDSNNNVTSWVDQVTGSYSVSNSVAGMQPLFVTNSQLNGMPLIRLTGQQGLENLNVTIDPGLNTDMTVIEVGCTTNPGVQQYAVTLGTWGNYGQRRSLGYYNFSQIMDADSVYALGSSVPFGEAYTVEGWSLDPGRTNVTFIRNGETGPSVAFSGVGNQSQGICIGEGYIKTFTWQGDIAEVLIYDHKLSSNEISKVNQYIGDKYGLYTPSATWPNAYSTSGQSLIQRNKWSKKQADNYTVQSSLNPNIMATGLALWFKADSGIATNGTNVVGWTDAIRGEKLNQYSAGNQPGYATNIVGGFPVVRYSGGNQWLYCSGNSTNAANLNSDMTMITVAATTNPSPQQYSVYLGSGGTGQNRAMGYYQSRELMDTYNIYGQGIASPDTNIFVTESWTLNSNCTALTFYQNGVQTASSTLSGVQNIGSGISIGAVAFASGIGWQGDIAEVLVYDHQLSSNEFAQVNQYIGDKYGMYNAFASWTNGYTPAVQAQIAKHQWNRQQADAYVAMQSANTNVLTTGLSMWYRADAGITTNSTNGQVTSWADQTGNYSVSQSSSNNQPLLITNDLSGKPALRFNGSQFLYNPRQIDPGMNGDMTMITVASSSKTNVGQFTCYLGNSSDYSGRGLGYYGFKQYFTTYNNDTTGTNLPDANIFNAEAVTLSANKTNVVFYRNGIQTRNTSISYPAGSVSPGVTIGGEGFQLNWQGDIAEVLVYDHQLSSNEFAQVNQYIGDKYGMYNAFASWTNGYTPAVQAQIAKHQWNRQQADAYVAMQSANTNVLTTGLSMWYRADAGITTNSTNGQVASWADQTGNYSVSQPSYNNQPLLITNDLSGKPALRFNGSQFLYNPRQIDPGMNSDMTIVTVGMTTNPNHQQYSCYMGGPNSSTGRGIGYYNGNQTFSLYDNDVFSTNPAITNRFAAEYATLDTNLKSINLYRDAIKTASLAASYPASTIAPGITIGSVGTRTDIAWQGDIAEVLVYDHQLSPQEMTQLGVYFIGKYGLYISVPAPVISPNGGTNSNSVNVTMTGYASPSQIRYTLDGSIPNSNSLLYSGQLSLIQSSQIQAAVFLNGVMISPIATAQYYIGDTYQIGISDAWQLQYFGTVSNLNPNALVPGGSGLTYLQAYEWGYDPTKYSSNGDGLSDYVNHLLGYGGNNLDINGDGLSNAQDLALGLNPFYSNTKYTTAPTANPNDHSLPVINLTVPSGANLLTH